MRLLPDSWLSRIEVDETGCWMWTGSVNSGGYGSFWVGSRSEGTTRGVLTHRFMYEQLIGPIPEKHDLDHLCRQRACCNPAHLEPVTRSENLRRGQNAEVRRRLAQEITHCPHGHEYTPENTRLQKSPNGGTGRLCIECRRAQGRARYYAQKAKG